MRTYHGSCHCGAVRFAADIDLSAGTMRCNCSFCLKIRCWAVAVRPDAFRLLAGEHDLTEYQFGAQRERHLFCKHCGVRPFGMGRSAQTGDFVGISVACLDSVTEEELAATPVICIDGKNDNWDVPPTHFRHL